MQDLLRQLQATSPWEAGAAALGLAYLMLAVRRNLLCWLCAFISTAIYLVLFARVALYMQSLLQIFYLAMAVYGFMEWRRGRDAGGEVLIRSWNARQHAALIMLVVGVSLLNGWLLSGTDAAAPYVDSFVTWGSVVTTWMVARRMIENWLYWIIVDGAAAWLYFSEGLLVTSALFAVYLGLVVHGYFVWRRQHRRQQARMQNAGGQDVGAPIADMQDAAASPLQRGGHRVAAGHDRQGCARTPATRDERSSVS